MSVKIETQCKECMHSEVCYKKDKLEHLVKAIKKAETGESVLKGKVAAESNIEGYSDTYGFCVITKCWQFMPERGVSR